jgi:hypothetical protein
MTASAATRPERGRIAAALRNACTALLQGRTNRPPLTVFQYLGVQDFVQMSQVFLGGWDVKAVIPRLPRSDR